MKPLNVLSLCDGMSCGQIALNKVGIPINNYYAAEIKNIAIKVTKHNYPDTIFIGNVNNIKYENGVLYTENGEYKTDIDLVMFGSPCQTFSIAMRKDKRVGRENKEKSGLFDECYRILKEINPKYFFVENVASMREEDKNYISELLGVQPHKIDAKLVSPAHRKRYYWTNIKPLNDIKEKNILLNDILDNGYSDKNKARSLLVSDSRPLKTPVKMFYRYFSSGFTTLIFKNLEHYEQCVKEFNRLKAMRGGVFDSKRFRRLYR